VSIKLIICRREVYFGSAFQKCRPLKIVEFEKQSYRRYSGCTMKRDIAG
jgi:hypothetical protein